MELCVATTSVSGDLFAKLETIATAGFTSIELHEPDLTGFAGTPQEVGQRAKSMGLSIEVLQPFYNIEGLSSSAREQAFSRLDCKLDLMEALGAKTLLVGSSTHADASHDQSTTDQDFAELAEKMGKRGLSAALIALPWARHIQAEMQAFDVVERVDNPHFGLALNSFFSLADGSKPAQLRSIAGEKIFHVQLSDAPVLDFDIRKLKSHFGLLPGQGGLNLASFVRVLARAGYKGPWSLARISDTAQGSRDSFARDGYRALVSLLDEVAQTEPSLTAPMPNLPPRVYPTGIEFIEFAADGASGKSLTRILETLCFRRERRHVSKSVELWRQGAINIVLNTETKGFAAEAFAQHGPSVCDMGLRVRDAEQTVARATALGAPAFAQPVGSGELDIPAIKGVGAHSGHIRPVIPI